MYLMSRWWIAEALDADVKAINMTNLSIKSLSDGPTEYPHSDFI